MDDQMQTSLLGDPNMLLPIEILNLTARTNNALANEGIFYIGQLITKSETELLKLPNLGRKQLRDISLSLNARGYKIGEGNKPLAGMEFTRSANLRDIYEIPDSTPTPSDWVPHSSREKIDNGFTLVTLQKGFATKIAVHISEQPKNQAVFQRIHRFCQMAFEVAVETDVHNAIYGKKLHIQDALKSAGWAFDEDADDVVRHNMMHGYVLSVELTLSSEANKRFGPRVLQGISHTLEGSVLTGFIAPLQLSQKEPK